MDAVGALLGSGTGEHERYGWSKLNCMELTDTPQVHYQEVIV